MNGTTEQPIVDPAKRLGSLSLVMLALVGAGAVAASWMDIASNRLPGAPPTTAAVKPPQAEQPPPPVEPLELLEMTREDAVALNAKIPFSTAPNPAAKPFSMREGEARARSIGCLTAAVYYEAGSEGDVGQRAVAQVVINRLRHPAFPKTVCGVVFQGSERASGCQFTFTCDGSLARAPSDWGWRRAREIATDALTGDVYKPVGHSTHYHTDWVVPYWSSSLEKVAAVGTHLFFRWQGWWGTPGAFGGRYAGAEPNIALLAGLSDAHAALAEEPADTKALAAKGAKEVNIVSDGGDSFFVVLDKKAPAGSYPALALATCGDKQFCKLLGWTDRGKAPKAYPMSDAQHRALSFSYLRNKTTGFEKMLWNCAEFARADPQQCMKPTTPAQGD